MIRFRLNSKSKTSIERATGVAVEEMSTMSAEEIDKRIEQKIGKKLVYKKLTNPRLVGRGSVYMYLNRLFSIDFLKKAMSKF